MDNITFDQLPTAVAQLFAKLDGIERLLHLQGIKVLPETDRWFDLNELCDYLPDKPAKATVYGYVHAGTIPCHKGQKKLRFLKSEIDSWLKSGRRKTVAELAAEADSYLQTKKRKG